MKTIKILLVLLIVSGMFLYLSSACYAQSPWIQKADMLNKRKDHALCEMDGKIYAFGGIDWNNVNATDNAFTSMEVYDPVQDTWTAKAEMGTKRCNFPACVYQGKILAVGGSRSLYWNPVNTIEEYDPLTDTWTTLTELPIPRLGLAASLVNGKIVVIGGSADISTNPFSEVDVYDLETDTWTSAAVMPTPRNNLSSAVLDGEIYAIGGMLGVQRGELGETTVEAYDPETDTWTTKAPLITPRKYFMACTLNGKIYVFGGASGYCEGILSSVEEYDPVTNTWKEGTDAPRILGAAGVASSSNGIIYISGGNIAACPPTVVKSVYTYNPEHDLFLLIENISVDKSFANAGIDSVCITAKISDPTGVTLLAEIEAPDQTPVDSLQLFDGGGHNDGNAGDSLFANVWPISSAEEQNYYVDLHMTRIDTDTVIQQMDNIAIFTTIGPVVFDSYTFSSSDTEPNPGDRLKIKLTLKNKGATASATDIEARLIGPDTLVNIVTPNRTYDDIAPGEIVQCNTSYTLDISEDFPVDTEIPFELEISSNGYVFWTDAFVISQTAVPDEQNNIPRAFALKQNYPNPFNPKTVISYQLPVHSLVELKIFDLLGREIATLVNEEKEPGEYAFEWNDKGLPSGIYFYHLEAQSSHADQLFHQTRKMVVLK